jgi:hypothetical protein
MGSVRRDIEGDVVNYRQPRYSDGPQGDFIIGKTLAGTTIRLTELQQQNHIILSASVGGGKASTVIIPNVLRKGLDRSLSRTQRVISSILPVAQPLAIMRSGICTPTARTSATAMIRWRIFTRSKTRKRLPKHGSRILDAQIKIRFGIVRTNNS